jgi:hypothetical protein
MSTFGLLAVLLHGNGRPHTAAHIRSLLEYSYLELFDHPPCSDYHLFICLKNWLRSQLFNNTELTFFDTGMHKLISRYYKCLNSDGDYVQK